MMGVNTGRRMTVTRSEPEQVIRSPRFFTLFLVWTAIGIISYARYLIEARLQMRPSGQFLEQLIEWLTCFYPWLLSTPPLFWAGQRFPALGPQWKRGTSLFLALSFVVPGLAYELTNVMDAAVRLAFGERPVLARSWWPIPMGEMVLEQAIYWPTVIACSLARRFIELREKERLSARLAVERSEIEAELRRSELELLRSRLNPHFLFNSLQNVAVLARQNPEAASQMLTQLGALLRAALRKDAQAQTTLTAEIELTKAYVAVEQIRFDGRLSVHYEIDPATERAIVPSFLLQPLVENAMNHGLKGGALGEIQIRSAIQEGALMLSVVDNGSGPPRQGIGALDMGIGLGSTCERLERLYPHRHTVSICAAPQGGTDVRITLPLEWEHRTEK